ncbi:MAG: RNA 2',3'-cyclic phosphodiesterase [Bacillota bacterium]
MTDVGSVRCFVALDLSAEVRAQVGSLLQDLSARHRGFRWVASATLHLTLTFLGEVEENRLPSVEQALTRAAQRWRTRAGDSAGIGWSLEGLGSFPAGRPVRVIWVGIKAGQDLAVLQRAVEEELAAEGFPREARPFAPHLTLARSRSDGGEPAPWLAEFQSRPYGHTLSREMVLFRSTLAPGGAIYSPLARVSLIP